MAKKIATKKAAESVRRDDEIVTAYSMGQKKSESNGDGAENPKKGRQKALEGDGFPGPLPEEVCDARDEFLTAMRAHAKTGKKKGENEQKLIEAMHKHDIMRVPLDGENKVFDIEAPEKIKMKTLPKEQRDERTAREHATAG